MAEVKNEGKSNIGAMLRKFQLYIKKSDILKEAKKAQFRTKPVSKSKRRKSALYRARQSEKYAERR
ncbi:MAG: hypothetical protein AAB593_02640 [Patescibacteria group bacterium]